MQQTTSRYLVGLCGAATGHHRCQQTLSKHLMRAASIRETSDLAARQKTAQCLKKSTSLTPFILFILDSLATRTFTCKCTSWFKYLVRPSVASSILTRSLSFVISQTTKRLLGCASFHLPAAVASSTKHAPTMLSLGSYFRLLPSDARD